MDLSALRRAYTGHTPDLMGARGGSAVLVPLVEAPEGTCLLLRDFRKAEDDGTK